jgi:serine/threonine protein kinase
MDFGLAKVVGQSANLTGRGVIMGTPAYIPPEQTGECPGEIGPHSDVYSLGAILYRLLTGRPVYEGETMLRTILLVVGPDMPPSVHELRPEVPASLSDICMKCLNKRPEDRYPDAVALARELRGYRAAEHGSASGIHAPLAALFLIPRRVGQPIPLTGSTTVIGRSGDCQVVLKSAEVSKRHCRIRIQDGRAELEDLQSVNGTILNGEPIDQAYLKDGDVIELGEHSFTVKLSKSLH